MDSLNEKVLWCAMKYALCLEEGDAVEAVLHTLKPKISELSDKTIYEMITAAETYVNRGKQFDFDAKFVPEWADVLAWLKEERIRRQKKHGAEE